MSQRGLDQDGLILREGSLSRVPDTFAPVVDAARGQITVTFGEQRLHSAYLYGSIPRGTAIPGVSDLDLMLALHHEPAPARQPRATAQEPPVTTSAAPRPRPVTPRQAAQILAERDPVLARLTPELYAGTVRAPVTS
jgi:hypothetical protein